ncbi:MAG: orotidine-5'-phosphate decarboxylase [Candidatus Aegiribacteria sp.]|nr:orotidine-5'-phosphate decarboxylase [Candidatus Aegiribacteria sp.]
MTFIENLASSWSKNDSLVCVGLDPDIEKIPAHLRAAETPLFEFNRAIIDQTADLVCAFKLQVAYYSASGAELDLELTVAYIHENYPGIPVILDAKRGDIGSTAEMYVREAFDRFGVDAVTVNPYMGTDTLEPFLDRSDRGVIILCRTSNPGAGDFQDLISDGRKLYQIVADKAAHEWNRNGNVLLVVGATYPDELREIRSIAGSMPFLVPGIGVQGGDVESAVMNGKNQDGTGMIINSSRGIIYSGNGKDFAEAARKAALNLRNEINRYR